MNKKASILTFHCVPNYGAVLQAYALQEVLKNFFDEVEILDYRPNNLTREYNVINYYSVFSVAATLFSSSSFKKKKQRFFEYENKYFKIVEDKNYGNEDVTVKALKKASFEIEKGELAIILGPSGAGKTTCLNILGGIDKASGGSVIVDGVNITELKERKLIKYRREDVGFVFQFYNLVQNLTAKENVELATQICKNPMDAISVIKKVGLTKRMDNFPSELSGGEQQRVAIARGVAKRPKLLLCDEPTGALDYKTGKQILKLLQNMAKKEKMTVVIITHNNAIAPMANKVITFKNGSVSSVKINKKPKAVGDLKW